MKLLEIEGGHVPQCPIASDATGWFLFTYIVHLHTVTFFFILFFTAIQCLV